MCGIAGFAGVTPNREVLARMGRAIAHRGPDAVGEMTREDVSFAFRRLAIIDLAGGNQPIFNEDGSVAIMLNGEIYNHRDLRTDLINRGHVFRTQSDVEAVVHLWEESKEECLHQLRGMFALAIWDQKEQSLFLARDRIGKKPLYFHELTEGGIVFGSEIKAILQFPGTSRNPDLSAIDQFLTLQYVTAPMTAFDGIKALPPAHWLLWRHGKLHMERYWALSFSNKLTNPVQELGEEVVRLLREAVRIRLESEVPLGAFLSGGIDSSAVVAFAAEQSGKRLSTFSIGFKDHSFDESTYARIVAQRFNTDHHELILSDSSPDLLTEIAWHYDQPFGDSSAVPIFHVAKITKPHVTVILNGDGGDENFAGYDRYRVSRFARFFDLPLNVRNSALALATPFAGLFGRGKRLLRSGPSDLSEAYFATLLHADAGLKASMYSPEFALAVEQLRPPPLQFMRSLKSKSPLDAMLETDINHYLPGDLLVKMDVATMASSLEGRSPFLDHKLMEFVARIPSDWKLYRGVSKYILKVALRGTLPQEVLNRPKMGFGLPVASLLRTSLKDLLHDTVLSSRALDRGLFREGALRTMVDRHMAGANEYRNILWDLIMLELWYRQFIDHEPALPTDSTTTKGLTRP